MKNETLEGVIRVAIAILTTLILIGIILFLADRAISVYYFAQTSKIEVRATEARRQTTEIEGEIAKLKLEKLKLEIKQYEKF